MINKPDKTQSSIKILSQSKVDSSKNSSRTSYKKIALGIVIGGVVASLVAFIFHQRAVSKISKTQKSAQSEVVKWKEQLALSENEIAKLKEEIVTVRGVAQATSESITRMIASEKSEEADESKCTDSVSSIDCCSEAMRLDKLGLEKLSFSLHSRNCERGYKPSCIRKADKLSLTDTVEAITIYRKLCNDGVLIACRRLGGLYRREALMSKSDIKVRNQFLVRAGLAFQDSCDQREKVSDQETADDCRMVALYAVVIGGNPEIIIKYSVLACDLGSKASCDFVNENRRDGLDFRKALQKTLDI